MKIFRKQSLRPIPYDTFEDFYSHYLREHKSLVNGIMSALVSLSLIDLFFNPRLIVPIFAGGLTAYSIISCCRHLSSGIAEVLAFMVVYLIGARLITGSFKRTFIELVLGYGFEKNKPATFIYPIFSLLGDFRMMHDAISRQAS